jgi:hypothetical protein
MEKKSLYNKYSVQRRSRCFFLFCFLKKRCHSERSTQCEARNLLAISLAWTLRPHFDRLNDRKLKITNYELKVRKLES